MYKCIIILIKRRFVFKYFIEYIYHFIFSYFSKDTKYDTYCLTNSVKCSFFFSIKIAQYLWKRLFSSANYYFYTKSTIYVLIVTNVILYVIKYDNFGILSTYRQQVLVKQRNYKVITVILRIQYISIVYVYFIFFFF